MRGARIAGAVTAVVCAAMAAGPWPAAAEIVEAAYSTIDWDGGCRVVEKAPEGDGQWVRLSCQGLGDTPVLVAEGDARVSLDYGAVSAPGAWESFSGFNRVNETIEWRLAAGRPFATIHRWFVDDGKGGERQVLVVSTVAGSGSGSSCMVGFVDANANPSANLIARGLADAEARGFRCGVDRPGFVGTTTATTPQPTGVWN